MPILPTRPPLCTGSASAVLPVFRSGDMRVVEGVNEGDPLSDARDLALGDIYALRRNAPRVSISCRADRSGRLRLLPGTATGRPGAVLHPDCHATFMEETGATREALVLVELDRAGLVAEVYLHPRGVFPRLTELALIRIGPAPAPGLCAPMGLAGSPGRGVTAAAGGV